LETNQIQSFGKSPEPILKPWKIMMVMITRKMVLWYKVYEFENANHVNQF
jgi:hypothetical protein